MPAGAPTQEEEEVLVPVQARAQVAAEAAAEVTPRPRAARPPPLARRPSPRRPPCASEQETLLRAALLARRCFLEERFGATQNYFT